jgi:hypothetical protein
MSEDGLSIDEKTALAGGGIAAVGALLPWTGGGIAGIGLDTAAEIGVLLCAIALFGLIYVADWTDAAQLITSLFGLVIAGIAGYTLLEAFGVIGSSSVAAGAGLYVTVLAGLLVLAGGVRGYTHSEPEAGMYSHR